MKNRIISLLAMFCVLALVGCENNSEPQATEADTPLNTETQTDAIATETTDLSAGQQVAAPADFAIHFETWIDGNQRNVLDTYEGYIQKDLVADGVSKKDYTPSHVELCQLYQFVLALEYRDELDFSKPVTYENYADKEMSVAMNPLVCYYLKFTANGKTIEISGDATAGECTDQSQEALYFVHAVRDIGHFCNNTDVYKSMPEAKGGYD